MKCLKAIIVICILTLTWMICFGSQVFGTNLSEERTYSKQAGDFILHIYTEKTTHGIKVFRALQYIGKEPIQIEHQTPLISLSFGKRKHDFTGGTVDKVLYPGASYFPQEEMTFSAPYTKGEHPLYAEAKYMVNGERMSIKQELNLQFN